MKYAIEVKLQSDHEGTQFKKSEIIKGLPFDAEITLKREALIQTLKKLVF